MGFKTRNFYKKYKEVKNVAFCPFINDECRNDCVFNKADCELLKIGEKLDKIQYQTTDCSYTYSIYSKLDDIIKELKR